MSLINKHSQHQGASPTTPEVGYTFGFANKKNLSKIWREKMSTAANIARGMDDQIEVFRYYTLKIT